MRKYLIVCTGNTCRSPMGEYILKNLLVNSENTGLFEVRSAGIYACPGEKASINAIEVMKEIGADILPHRSRALVSEDVEKAEKIYVMTNEHKNAVIKNFPNVSDGNIFVIGVPDPYGGDIDKYRLCRDILMDFFEKEVSSYEC